MEKFDGEEQTDGIVAGMLTSGILRYFIIYGTDYFADRSLNVERDLECQTDQKLSVETR